MIKVPKSPGDYLYLNGTRREITIPSRKLLPLTACAKTDFRPSKDSHLGYFQEFIFQFKQMTVIDNNTNHSLTFTSLTCGGTRISVQVNLRLCC